jgi:hypothetical protein
MTRVRRVELDYTAPVRRAPWAGLAVLAVSLAVAGVMLERHRGVRSELARLEAQSGLAGPERREVRALSKERLDEEAKSAEAVVRQLTVPWASVVQAIEEASMRDVALLQLQPDADTRSLKLVVEARQREAMFEYLRRLGAARGLSDVHIVSHQVQRDDPQRPIQFSVQASMKGLK